MKLCGCVAFFMSAIPPLSTTALRRLSLNNPVYTALKSGHHLLAGVDEAGVGPLAGPVVAAAVLLNPYIPPPPLSHLDDSKRLSSRRRAALRRTLQSHPAFKVSISIMSAAEIDRVNIFHARMEVMRRAVEGLSVRPKLLFVDGSRELQGLDGIVQRPVVGGDGKISLIAMASVVAKELRDEVMREMDEVYPHYGFGKHKGYATREHLHGLKMYGPCEIHRRSFRPVQDSEDAIRPV